MQKYDVDDGTVSLGWKEAIILQLHKASAVSHVIRETKSSRLMDIDTNDIKTLLHLQSKPSARPNPKPHTWTGD